jgi:hypothetical protein
MSNVHSGTVPFFHELEKGSRISRVILFASTKPKDVFRLSMVGHFWRECFVDFKYGKDIFRDKVFDARLPWQSAEDVESSWNQAAKIMRKQETAQQQQPLFEPELHSEIVAAIRNENARCYRVCSHSAC